MSDSVRPHREQPTRLLRPWDSPGKNSGVGCHFLLQCMKVKSESEVARPCLTLRDPMDCSLPGSSVHGIFQARVPEWGAIAFSHYSSRACAKSPQELSEIWAGRGGAREDPPLPLALALTPSHPSAGVSFSPLTSERSGWGL